MKQDKKFIKKKFDKIVKRYDIVNLIASFGQDKIWRKKVANILKNVSSPLLDICCGPYTLTLQIFKKNKKEIFALDFSFGMLLYGKKRITRTSIYPVCGDAEVLPFKDEIFGGISIAFGLRNLPNKEIALKEFYRVLKKGGILIILEFSLPTHRIFKTLYQIYLKNYLPFLGWLLTGDKTAYLYLVESIQKFSSSEKIKELLINSGFNKVEHISLTMGIVSLYTAYKN